MRKLTETLASLYNNSYQDMDRQYAGIQTKHSVPIILIPGFKDDEHKLRDLAAYMRNQGHTLHMLSPQPSRGYVGIDVLAEQVVETIEETYPPGQRVDLFGFSMGGLIGRYYLQRLGGIMRVRRFVTLATPHNGTWMAYAYPTRVACIQMRPNSAFLAELNEDLSPLKQVDFTSIWSPVDLTIQPASSSVLPIGREKRVLSIAHGLLPHDPAVIREVAQCFSEPYPTGEQAAALHN